MHGSCATAFDKSPTFYKVDYCCEKHYIIAAAQLSLVMLGVQNIYLRPTNWFDTLNDTPLLQWCAV